VYHFSYDRGALLALYDLFLELYQQGKSLYILAGNHDRLGGSFVFEEAKKAFETLSGFFANAQNDIYDKMHFITSPTLTEIEGEQICFLPYMLDVNLGEYSGIEQLQDDFYHEQIQTENKNQILSAKLHLLVQYFKNHQPNLTFIHHYYFDGVAFPGQKSKFSFRDVALSSQWLEDRDLHFISGHLHQSFAYKNYLCTGSVWATSPLEENQLKGVWKLSEGKRSFYEFGGNFYFAMDCLEQASSLFDSTSKVLEADDVQRHHEVLKEAFKKNFG
jgi:DNA repair exonuclease SbcCD nuclease subunit